MSIEMDRDERDQSGAERRWVCRTCGIALHPNQMSTSIECWDCCRHRVDQERRDDYRYWRDHHRCEGLG